MDEKQFEKVNAPETENEQVNAPEAENETVNVPEAENEPIDMTGPETTGGGKKQKQKKSAKQEIKEWIVALAVALVVVFVIQTFFFRIIRVDGQSMESTLHDGERLYVDVMSVKFSDSVPRGSVVICNYPNRYTKILGIKFDTFFVKRVVAVPGDQVYRKNGVTHVVYEMDGVENDVELDSRMALYTPYGSPDDYEPYTLSDNEYFVVGDNRYNSHDSRDWNDSNAVNDVGPISKDMIIGRVREVIWPLGDIRSVK
ncbi:MAG: signal peptidase I [Clostridia bacterium]|nr:signal peptidase I [Clostridia bacterium]